LSGSWGGVKTTTSPRLRIAERGQANGRARNLRPVHRLVHQQEVAHQQRGLHAAVGMRKASMTKVRMTRKRSSAMASDLNHSHVQRPTDAATRGPLMGSLRVVLTG
jgi:hypothetical protein